MREIQIQGRPLDVAPGQPDKRPVIVAGCTDRPVATEGRGPRLSGLHRIRAVQVRPDGSRLRHILTPEYFWNWALGLRPTGRAVLILCDPNRDLALLGLPSGMRWRGASEDAECECEGITPPSPLNTGSKFIGKLDMAHGVRPGRRGFDVLGLGNLHPDGLDCHALTVTQAAGWVTQWLGLIDAENLGPKLMPTPPAQALRSLQRRWAEAGRTGWELQWHENADLADFEHEVMAAQSPVRITPTNAGPYPFLHHYDFTAHYLTIMATRRLPARPLFWYPDGLGLDAFNRLIVRQDVALIADVRAGGNEALLTTPDLRRHREVITEVRRAALYRAGTPMSEWATEMFNMRHRVDHDLAVMAKRIGVSLWGYLARRNMTAEVDADPNIDNAALWGAGRMWDDTKGGIGMEFDSEGNCCVTKPSGGSQRGRYRALGAHMIAYGARAITDLMSWLPADAIIASHTDSVWSTMPLGELHSGAGVEPKDLGGVTHQLVPRVAWRNGNRYICGNIDAAPGMRRPGTVTYLPFDDPRQAPGKALFEVAQ